MRKYDTDGKTRIKLNLKPTDKCPECGRKHLFIRDIATLLCRACGEKFNRWVKV